MQKRKGFTLVELVIVIAVIAILVGVLIGTFASVVNKANESAKVQELKQQEIAQKADDLLIKLDNPNWLGWEDFEVYLVSKLTEVYKNDSSKNITSDEVKAAINDAFSTYMVAHLTETTNLTEDQVKAIIENALGTLNFSGVTEAQVKAIVTQATSTQVTASQVKAIVIAANANNLTANDVAKIVAEKSASIDDITAVITTASSTPATRVEVEEILAYLTANASNNVVIAKALNIKLSQNGLSTVSCPDEVVSVVGETLLTTTDSTPTILLYINPESKAPTFVVKDSTGFVYNGGLTKSDIKDVDLWTFATEVDTKYSTYLLKASTVETVDNLTTGLDVGENDEVTDISYVRTSGESQTVVIRTKSESTTLTINAPNDTVNHYGDVSKVDIQQIDMNCYNEYGNATYVKVTEGKVVAKDGSKIDVVFANNTDQTIVAVINEKGVIEAGYTIVADTINQDRVGGIPLTSVTEASVNTIDNDAIKIDIIENSGLYEARIGTKGYKTFEGAKEAIENGEGETLVLCKNIVRDKDCVIWYKKAFNIDLNNHTYETIRANDKATYHNSAFAFQSNTNVTIKNGTIKTRYGAPIYAANATITLENVNLYQDPNYYFQASIDYSSAIRITSSGNVIGKVTVNSGTFEGRYALNVGSNGGEFVINDGTFTNSLVFNSGISDRTKAKVEINGGTFNNFSVINTKKGTVTINGGSFTVSDDYVDTLKSFVKTGKTVTINGEQYTK